MTFISGAYSGVYKGSVLGQFDDGFELEQVATIEDIDSDIFRGVEDGVLQGIGLVIRLVLNEPTSAGGVKLLWPYNATLGTTGIMGRLMTSLAGPLVFTKCAGTTASPSSITIPRAVIWRDPIRSRYGNFQRKVPVVIAGLPLPSGGSSGVMGCAGGALFSTT